MPNNKKVLLIFSIFLLTFFSILLIFLLFYNFSLNKKIEKPLEISIISGMSKSQVLDQVCSKECSNVFTKGMLKVYLFLNKDLIFEVGDYKVDTNNTFVSMFNSFKNGTKQQKITFLEGWTVYENSYYLKQVVGSEFAKNYLQAAKNLEGYLYPNTYFIDLNTTPQSLVDLQINQFNKEVGSFKNANNLTKDEVIKLAAIVEREGLGNEDRPVIAGILIKRYLEGMPLDADATSQYGLFLVNYPNFLSTCLENTCNKPIFWTQDLNIESLKLNEEYNTRGSLGLTPKPICNPSFNSINAVLNPSITDYYFYLHAIGGKTYYAKTLDEHIANINNFL